MDDLLKAVKQLSPGLTSSISDDALKGVLTNTREIATADGFPVDATNPEGERIKPRDMATEYLTLHLITINKALGNDGNNVTSEQVSVLKRTYADVSKLKLFQRSPWGQFYLWRYTLYGTGAFNRYSLVQH